MLLRPVVSGFYIQTKNLLLQLHPRVNTASTLSNVFFELVLKLWYTEASQTGRVGIHLLLHSAVVSFCLVEKRSVCIGENDNVREIGWGF